MASSREDADPPDYDMSEITVDRNDLLHGSKIRPFVVGGKLSGTINIAIKAFVKPRSKDMHDFLREARIGAKCNHENVVKTVGTCRAEWLILTEYQQNKSLIKYSSKVGLLNDQRISVAKKIVNGMVYLVSIGIVHRDLAARNVFVGETIDDIKIGDFGMSRELGDEDSFMVVSAHFSAKWTAPEAFLLGTSVDPSMKGVFSHAADVWSFGIVLWEIYSNGKVPYAEFTGSREQFHHELTVKNVREKQPPNCPEEIFNVMNHCWEKNPSERPTFRDLQTIFRYFHVPEERRKANRALFSSVMESRGNGYSVDPILRSDAFQAAVSIIDVAETIPAEPAPPAVRQCFIKAFNGLYVRAWTGPDRDAPLYVDFTHLRLQFEVWYIISYGEEVLLKTYDWGEKYLNAGTDGATFMSDQAGEFSKWSLIENDEDQTTAFLNSHHQVYLSAVAERGTTMPHNKKCERFILEPCVFE